MRVIKWKEDEFKDKHAHTVSVTRKDALRDFRKHDFILLTDSEKFVKENTQFLEGIHHLPENQQVYKYNKIDFTMTSEDMDIESADF